MIKGFGVSVASSNLVHCLAALAALAGLVWLGLAGSRGCNDLDGLGHGLGAWIHWLGSIWVH